MTPNLLVGATSGRDSSAGEDRDQEIAPTGPTSTPTTTHATRVVVWDSPPAVECGATFRVKVGVKCASQCSARDWRIEIRDDAGHTLASATVGEAPWPGTAALYVTEIELPAPQTKGLHAWTAHASAVDGRGPDDARHDASSAPFNVRTVPTPACRINVVAMDAESRRPAAGVNVVIHPYRTVTDDRGCAEICVPKGRHRLFVSGRGYLPFRHDGEIDGDVVIEAELHLDLGPTDAELWS